MSSRLLPAESMSKDLAANKVDPVEMLLCGNFVGTGRLPTKRCAENSPDAAAPVCRVCSILSYLVFSPCFFMFPSQLVAWPVAEIGTSQNPADSLVAVVMRRKVIQVKLQVSVCRARVAKLHSGGTCGPRTDMHI